MKQWRKIFGLKSLRRRLPFILLVLLIGLHLALATIHQADKGFVPSPLTHYGFTLVVDQTRILQGHTPLSPSIELNQSSKTVFDGKRDPNYTGVTVGWLLQEMYKGRFKGVWYNENPLQDYWNDIPLPYFIAALMHHFSGGSIMAAALTPMIFLAVLLLAIYGIGRQAGGPWTGLGAAAITAGYPGVFELARTHHDSLALGAAAAVLVYAIMRGDGFRRWWACALAGVIACLASRTGETITGFFTAGMIAAGPFLLEFYRLIRRLLQRAPGAWRGLVGMALVLSPSLLLIKWRRVLDFSSRVEESIVEEMARPELGTHVSESWAGLLNHLAYFFQLAFESLQPMMTLWLIVGALLIRGAPRGYRLAVALMVAVPLLPLSWMPKKATWYLYPCLPAMGLVTALGLQGLKSPRLRQWALGLAAACGLAMPLFYTLVPKHYRDSVDLDRISPKIKTTMKVHGFGSQNIDWHYACAESRKLAAVADQFLALDRRVASPGKSPRRVLLLGINTHPNEAFRYVVELRRPDLLVVDFFSEDISLDSKIKMIASLEEASFDYLIYLGSNMSLPWPQDPWDPYQWRRDWQYRFPEGTEWIRQRLAQIAKKQRLRKWARVDLPAGPIYMTTDQ